MEADNTRLRNEAEENRLRWLKEGRQEGLVEAYEKIKKEYIVDVDFSLAGSVMDFLVNGEVLKVAASEAQIRAVAIARDWERAERMAHWVDMRQWLLREWRKWWTLLRQGNKEISEETTRYVLSVFESMLNVPHVARSVLDQYGKEYPQAQPSVIVGGNGNASVRNPADRSQAFGRR